MSYLFGFNQPPLAPTCALCQVPLVVPAPWDPDTLIRNTDGVELLCNHRFHKFCIMAYVCNLRESKSCPLCDQSVLDSANRFMVRIRDCLGISISVNLNTLVAREEFILLSPHVDRSKRFLSLFHELTDDLELRLARLMLLGQDLGSQGQRIHPDTFELIDGDQKTTALHLAALNDDLRAARLLLRAGATKDLLGDDGLSALDIAREAGSRKVEAFLRREGAQYSYYFEELEDGRDLTEHNSSGLEAGYDEVWNGE